MREEPPRREIGRRLVLGAVAVVLASAVAAGALVSNEVSSLTSALSSNTSLDVGKGELAGSGGGGGPQTLLLVGDDRRALTKYYHHAVLPHSNEMLLVRFDPSKPYISMLSIPRDLQVTIYPPNGRAVTTRFNYAYTAGGIPTLLQTIKRVLGLSPNHVVVITFTRFKRAVDEMGCVYSTIDHRYYHSNAGSAEQYQEINLQPGYQRLCGRQALEFVSYRHGDTALVRDARNQSFLLDVKAQYGPGLFDNRDKFEKIFGRAVQTDPGLHTTAGVLNLLDTLASSAGRPVRQVPFQANLGAKAVTATPAQIAGSVRAFLYGRKPPPKVHTAAVARSVRRGGASRAPGRRARGHGGRGNRGGVAGRSGLNLALVPTPKIELAEGRALGRILSFPLEYPRMRDSYGAGTPVTLRGYYLRGTDNQIHRVYIAPIPAGILDQYYDVQGMAWPDAPVFGNPDQTVRVGGRTYLIFYDADHVRMVAWKEHGAVYWIRNSLTNVVGNAEMLALAEQTLPFGVPGSGVGRHGAPLRILGLPKRPPKGVSTDTAESIGAIFALLSLLGIAGFVHLLLVRRRELRALRADLRIAMEAQARERAALYARLR